MEKKELAIFTAYIHDQCKIAEGRRELVFTNFLDMQQTSIVEQINRSKEYYVQIDLYGGFAWAERKICAIYPSYGWEIGNTDYPIQIIVITCARGTLDHRSCLGSLMGLGIKRSAIGDIAIDEQKAFVFVKDEIGDFIYYNLTKVGNQSVEVERRNLGTVQIPEPKFKKVITTAASNRVDAVIASVFPLSRGQSSDLIQKGRVFINALPIMNGSKQVNENDKISIRGYGKIQIVEFGGKTKKDRLHMTIKKYI